MKRTRAIFETVFGLPSAAKPASAYRLEFVTVEDALPPAVLLSRQEREASSLRTFKTVTRHQWKDLSDLHGWIFMKHNSYSSTRLTANLKENISADVYKTY